MNNNWQETLSRLIREAVYEASDGYCRLSSHQLEENNNAYQEVEDFIQNTINQTEKAYGGCQKCYGKGYSTEQEGNTIYHADFIGDKTHVEPGGLKIHYCDCDRGKYLENTIIPMAEKETADKIVSEAWKCRIELKSEGWDERPVVTHGDLRSIANEIKLGEQNK